ncbi:MAG: hypothetical protein JNL79_37805 [Myxococcales bacterium]|nr:hypothetical protein [Myxococcales bacterium]
MSNSIRASIGDVRSLPATLRAQLAEPLTGPERAVSLTLAAVAAVACLLGFFPRPVDGAGMRLLVATTSTFLAMWLGRLALRQKSRGGAITATLVFGALLGALNAQLPVILLFAGERHGSFVAVLLAGCLIGALVGGIIGVLYGIAFAPFVAWVRKRLGPTFDDVDRVHEACGAALAGYAAFFALLTRAIGPTTRFGDVGLALMALVGLGIVVRAEGRRRARRRFVATVADGHTQGLRLRVARADEPLDQLPVVDGEGAVLEAYGDDGYRDAPVPLARVALH